MIGLPVNKLLLLQFSTAGFIISGIGINDLAVSPATLNIKSFIIAGSSFT